MRMLLLVASVAAIALPAAALADDNSEQSADELFEQATKAKQAGHLDEACKLFKSAYDKSKDAVGMILNVAQCDEDLGHYQSAIRHFEALEGNAREHGFPQYLKAAQEHLAKLRPLVSKVSLVFTEWTPDTRLVVDDEVVPIDLDPAKRTVPVDAGDRHVTVSRPGRVSFQTTVKLDKAETKILVIPKLDLPVIFNSTRRNIGIATTAIGGASVVAGGVLALVAKRNYDRELSNGNCSRDTHPPSCNSTGLANTHSAHTLGNVATGLVAAGAAVAVFGGYLWYFAPRGSTKERTAIVPIVAPDGAGVAAIGRF